MDSLITIWRFFTRSYHRLASPKEFYKISRYCLPVFAFIALVCLLLGTYLALFVSPADYQQGESVRIMYVHVPAAWLSLFIYTVIAFASAIGLIWRIKMAFNVAIASASIGASFTALALVTGSLWGAPIWGTWWEWDARLTSELILLFLYFGLMATYSAFEEKQTAENAMAILAVVGVVIVPIIHYSVDWWNNLHQGATVFRSGGPSMPIEMLQPLILMAIGFSFFYAYVLFIRLQTKVLQQQNSAWVIECLHVKPSSNKQQIK